MTEPGPATPDRRRTFAPVAGLGVVSAGVATLAGSRSWIGSVSLGGDTTTSDGSIDTNVATRNWLRPSLR